MKRLRHTSSRSEDVRPPASHLRSAVALQSMRLWLSHTGEIPIREQLVTQVILAIVSGELRPGQRLPSTREIARRFRVHANTVSSAYRQLQQRGWLTLRQGSGLYVQTTTAAANSSKDVALDRMILGFFRSAREFGIPLSSVRLRLSQWLATQPPHHFLVIEPDEDLLNILVYEIRRAVTLRVDGCTLNDSLAEKLHGAIPLALPSKLSIVTKRLPSGIECLPLPVRSVAQSLEKWLPAADDRLVGIASRWPNFLQSARTMLVAAGFDTDSLLLRDVRRNGWRKGLEQASAVVCDSVTAELLPKKCRSIRFELLADATLSELREYEQFLGRAPI